jgi:hypothetical protein
MEKLAPEVVSLGLMLALLALMACVVLAFRIVVRRPRGVSEKDAPGIRSVAVFQGDAPDLFRDDHDELPWVGVRLFSDLCAGLAAKAVRIEDRGPVEYAQGARCVVDGESFSLVLERLDDCWAASVEYSPRAAAEIRHARWSHKIYAPGDSPALRRLLTTLDGWLKGHPQLSSLGWHRKEKWLGPAVSEPAPQPFEP